MDLGGDGKGDGHQPRRHPPDHGGPARARLPALREGPWRRLELRVRSKQGHAARYLHRAQTDLERYLHAETHDLPPLVRIGLVHAQFETIHPYLDGNGRLGRLLITLLFEHWRLLAKPLLYLSLFFQRRRDEYYQRLTAVRSDGDWEGWTSFFLEGVAAMASESVQTAKKLFRLVTLDRERVLSAKRVSLSAVRLFEQLPRRPILTAAGAEALLSTTRPTAAKAISTLVDLGVLKEVSGKLRDRSFVYVNYLEVLGSEVAP